MGWTEGLDEAHQAFDLTLCDSGSLLCGGGSLLEIVPFDRELKFEATIWVDEPIFLEVSDLVEFSCVIEILVFAFPVIRSVI